ncbi:MAG: fibronectin type III domain-containing protein [Lachnospiraceae bacterium]|nr:fibronectin type III domain-containing protein [Lachnospiraceae bacterium]
MKSLVKFSKVWMLALLCVLFLGVGIKAEAAPGQVTGLKQTNYDTSAVQIGWNNVTGATEYLVEYSENNSFTGTSVKAAKTNRNPVAISGLAAGSSYYVRVTAVDQDGNEGAVSQPLEVVTAPVDKISNLKQTKAENKKITLSWSAVQNANAYYIRYGKNTNSLKEAVTTNPSYVISGTADSAYIVYVYPMRKSSANFEAIGPNGSYVIAATVPKKITKVKMLESGSSSNPKAGIVVFSWGQSKAADGYEYEIYGNNGKKILKKSITASQYSTRGIAVNSGKLKNTQFMKIRVHAYTKVGNAKKYGPWSDYCYFAKFPNNVKQAPVNNSTLSAGVKITWSKIAGANNYTIYISTKSTGGWKKAGTTKSNSFVVKKCGSSALKTGVTYYYKVVANKKVKGKTYSGDKDWYKKFGYIMRTYYY